MKTSTMDSVEPILYTGHSWSDTKWTTRNNVFHLEPDWIHSVTTDHHRRTSLVTSKEENRGLLISRHFRHRHIMLSYEENMSQHNCSDTKQ